MGVRSAVISDEKTIQELNDSFESMKKKLEPILYKSHLSEKNRFIYFYDTWKLPITREEIIEPLFTYILKDLNGNLNYSDLKQQIYLRGGSSSKKKIAFIDVFDEKNFKLEFEWITNESLIRRTFVIKKRNFNKKSCKVKMTETVKGNKALGGMQGMWIKNRYIRNRVVEFQIAMLEFEKDILKPEQKRINKILDKIDYLERVLDRSN